jgi:hypothetical protein
MADVFRLILQTAPGRVDTGATYSGCNRSNPNACQPLQTATIQAAVDYAHAHNEIPVRVSSVDEAWNIAEGKQPIQQSQIITGSGGDLMSLFSDPIMLGVAAIGVIFLVPKLFKKKGGA